MRKTKGTKRGQSLSNRGDDPLAGEIASAALVRMRESNHRIKNHLQLLRSVLALQSRHSVDDPAREALLDASSRVAAVGRLHERLEEAEHGDSIDAGLFLRGLCSDLRSTFATAYDGGLKLEVDVEQASFPAKRMLPIGLMVSELVTNAVKHCGAENACRVHVRLRRAEANWHLTVADDGPGMDADALGSRSRLGGRLLLALTQQISGSIGLDKTEKGASISVLFPS